MNSGKGMKRSQWKLALAALPVLAFTPVGQAAIINVTGLTDVIGTCDAAVSPVQCPSLRDAVIYANGLAGADTITLPAGTYVLSIDGVDETWSGNGTDTDPYVAVITPDATKGDLDITDSVTITGTLGGTASDQLATTIQWDEKSIVDPDVGDRIFHIQALLTGAAVNVTLSNLIFRDGSVGVTPNTDCSVTDNPYDIAVVSTEPCSIWQFRRMGGAVSIGPGAAVVLYEAAVHGPGMGGGSGAPRGPYPGGKPGEGETEGGVIEGVTLSKVAFIGNQSGADGGGVYNAAPTTIEGSVFSGNTSGTNGGAIYNDAVMTIKDTTMGKATSIPFLADAIAAEATLLSTGNSAEGGGAFFDTGVHTTRLEASSIVGNTATGGAGISARALVVINIVNSTISGNTAKDVGGGITTNGAVNLTNSTVAYNDASSDAPGGGGGLNSFGKGVFTLLNTIVSNNVRNEVDSNCGCSGGATTCDVGRIVSLGHNLENANTCVFLAEGDLPSTSPFLKAIGMNGGQTETHALPHSQNGDAVDSPAVDHGHDEGCPNNDQRGSIRPFDGDFDFIATCDIGAFELFVPTADIHIENMSAVNVAAKNDIVTVEIDVHNPAGQVGGTDNVDASNVVLTAFVDSSLTDTSASFVKTGGSSTACAVSGTKVTCAIGTLATDQTAVVIITATAGTTGTFEVTASVTSDTKDSLPGNNADGVSVKVIGHSDLTVTGSAAAKSVNVGDTLSVTFKVGNGAGSDAATNVRLGVSHSDNVSFASTTTPGVTCVASNSADGEVNCLLDDLAATGSIDVTLLFTTLSSGEAELSASVVSDQYESDDTNNTTLIAATLTTPITATSDSSSSSSDKNIFGCSATRNAAFDPLFPLIVTLSLAGLYFRGRRGRQPLGSEITPPVSRRLGRE